MINYLTYKTDKLVSAYLDDCYAKLLDLKLTLVRIMADDGDYILTKEKSLFMVDNFNKFLEQANSDIYYKTVFGGQGKYLEDDLKLYRYYLNKYKSKIMKIYADRYLFGSVAVRTDSGKFITTVRGKKDLSEFTVVDFVDHVNHTISLAGKKATLNTPLLDKLFQNPKVKAIVHINHKYDDSLPYYPYAFPGTVRDSYRCNLTSFNIENHGLIFLFDVDKQMIKDEKYES